MVRVLLGCFLICGALWLADAQWVNAGSGPKLTGQKEWQAINEADQLWYLKGLYDGAFLAEERQHYKQDLPRTTLGEMRRLLGAFYNDPENADIPVPHALVIIRLEQAGTPLETINAFRRVVQELWGRNHVGQNGARDESAR